MTRHALWLVLLLACAGGDASQPELRVGTSGDYAPFTTRTASGERTGFDVDVVRAYAHERGLRVRWVPVRWRTLDADFAAGRFDVVMSGVTVRPERSLAGRFTVPVATAGAVLLVRGGGEPARIVVNAGGHLERVARRLFPAASLRALSPNAAVRAALLAGEADAAVTDTLEAPAWLAGTQGLQMRGPFTRDAKAYWLPAAAGERAHDLSRWLLAREADGSLAALRARHLPGHARAATATPAAALAAAIEERLALMPLVAEAKRRSGAPVEAPAQEQAVLESALVSVREAATQQGVEAPDPTRVRALFIALIAAAREVQTATLAGPPGEGEPPSLDATLRPALARISERIAWLVVHLPASPAAEIENAIATLDVPGVTPRTRADLASAARALAH